MDTPPPADVYERELVARLAADWSIHADDIRYAPKGAGSYHWIAHAHGQAQHFVTVDDLDTKPWIAYARDPAFDGLEVAYETAWRLQHSVGLAFVVGPVRSRDDAAVVRLSDRYTMTVFPFIEGVAGAWGAPLLREGRSALLHDLARLHLAMGELDPALLRRTLDLPERPMLTAAMQAVDEPWHGGPMSEPARQALADHADDVNRWLAELDTLASHVQAGGRGSVLTHGEPHPGNLIHTPDGPRLIDWDTVALAPPERDLWMLDDGAPAVFAQYEADTGRPVDDAAICFYRLAWTLSDIASFADMFRSPHEHTRWLDQKWDGFQRLLDGESSTPYGQH